MNKVKAIVLRTMLILKREVHVFIKQYYIGKVYNVPPTQMSFVDGDLGLKSHPKDRRAGNRTCNP